MNQVSSEDFIFQLCTLTESNKFLLDIDDILQPFSLIWTSENSLHTRKDF